MRQVGLAVAMSLVFVASVAAQPPARAGQPSIQLPAELERVLRDYEIAWQNKDAPALAALFAEDGFVLSSGSPPVRGRSVR
jgi:hypothetical protein